MRGGHPFVCRPGPGHGEICANPPKTGDFPVEFARAAGGLAGYGKRYSRPKDWRTCMKSLKSKHRARLLEQIARDIEASASLLKAAAAAAGRDAAAGRGEEALQHLLGVEGEVYDAGRLINLASYVTGPAGAGADSGD